MRKGLKNSSNGGRAVPLQGRKQDAAIQRVNRRAHPGAPDPKTRPENGHGAGHFLITL